MCNDWTGPRLLIIFRMAIFSVSVMDTIDLHLSGVTNMTVSARVQNSGMIRVAAQICAKLQIC